MVNCTACGDKAFFKVMITETFGRNLCVKHYNHWRTYGKDEGDSFNVICISQS